MGHGRMPEANVKPHKASKSSPWLVLLADDSGSMRKSLAAAIKDYDTSIEIIEAVTGQQALDVLVGRSPDIAFINLQLPDITGAEALAWASRQNVRPLTILMSNQVLAKWVEVSTALGAYEFWQKRLDPAHVVELLKCYRLMRTPMRLLLVDESASAHEIIGRMMANSRFTLDVDHSTTGPDALGLMRRAHYDLALIDATFSGDMSGLEIAYQIRDLSPSTKVIFMASDKARGTMQAARRFGLSSFLAKPFHASDLDFALHSEFELRRPYLLNALVAPPPTLGAAAHR
jgi:DNA-binding NarL/FixJ family response regulator